MNFQPVGTTASAPQILCRSLVTPMAVVGIVASMGPPLTAVSVRVRLLTPLRLDRLSDLSQDDPDNE
jgi:hypothetical protein